MRSSRSSGIIAWAIVLIFMGGWEAAVQLFQTPAYILPAPSQIIRTLIENPDAYLQASALTLGESLAGLLIGVLAGGLLAVLLVLFPGLEGGVMTLAILIKSTPLVAIAPLLTIWLGFGVVPKIVITSLMTFFPVLVNMLGGLQRVDPALMDLFHSWNASRWEVFRHLRLPNSLPYLFSALKISAPLALIGAVVAEWTGASGGLGRTMWMAYTNLNLTFLFAAIFILAVAGMALFRLLAWQEGKSVFWQQNNREE